MKILFIGGTGTISTAITEQLAATSHELFLLNRGNNNASLPDNVRVITADINNEDDVKAKLKGMTFDSVCDFIGFVPEHVERDFRIFNGITKQYIYISSASAYAKPVRNHIITEGTSLVNPYWEYSRNKIACERFLMDKYRYEGFPVTIVRPSHTYCKRSVPLGLHGLKGSFQVLKRMIEGKPVIIHGDGSSLWTMTYNQDFARGFIGLIGNPHAIGEVFQITSDESLTWNQIYETVASHLGVSLNPLHVSSDFLVSVAPKEYDLAGNLLGDKACTVVFDNTKLKRAVPGFCATTSFYEGSRIVIDYVMSHKECQVLDPEFDAWCDKVVNAVEGAKKGF